MNKTNNKGGNYLTRYSTTGGKRKLPKNISKTTSGVYRVRKMVNGHELDLKFDRLKDAKAFVQRQSWY